jgi:Beta propeller domain
MTIDGSFVSGRMVGDSVRLVLTSGPVGFEWAQPKGSGLRAERDATEANREIVRNSTADNWIPYFMVSDADGRIVDEGTLFDCERASHPSEFSGVEMLSVVTVDIGDGLEVSDSTGVLARGDTVYASEDNLYVATQDWGSWRWMATGDEADRPDGPVTEIHKFDITDPSRTEYLASGSVDGYLLNQFAMDEHEEILRVASTTTPNWWGSGPESESRITMLREIGDGLVRVGTIDGLGETEQIYSVRFMGDVAYVVTFRQTDPLYTVDLSDPRSPRLLGELKIPGYSAYLHPIADGRLLGIGQDATDEGMVQGSQVSLFDVSDLANPVRLDTHTLSEGTTSEVEYDHHAFLYWEGLAMIPVQQWNWDGETEEVFVGAIGVAVEGDDLVEVARITHPGGDGKDWDYRAQIMRSIAIGDSLYTISPKGILQSSIDTLDEQAWLDF